METVRNAMRREAERVGQRTAQTRLALVSSYDPTTYMVKVRYQPENVESGWAPLSAMQVGGGWGMFAPPSIGDQVVVLHQEGHGGSPIVIGSLYSEEDRPVVDQIQGCPAKELRLVGEKGQRLRLLADGTVEIRQQAGSQVLMKPDGSVEINAPTVSVGAADASFLRLLDERFHAWAVAHVHPNTGPPLNPPSLPASATTNLKGA